MPISVLHIGKTGGTALMAALRANADRGRLEFHGHTMTLSRLWSKRPRRKVIFGVREPVSRYVSAFNSRLREGRPRHFTPWSSSEEIAFSIFRTPGDLAESIYDPDQMRRALAQLCMLGINHVNKTYTHLLGGLPLLESNRDLIRFVYRQESLDQDFTFLSKLLRLPAGQSLPTDDVATHRTPDGMSTDLSNLAQANLAKWYAQDIEIYDWCCKVHDERVDF